jgi:hypothetical protein
VSIRIDLANVPEVRGWVNAAHQNAPVARVVLVELPDDRQAARIGGAQLTQPVRAGDSLTGRRVGER